MNSTAIVILLGTFFTICIGYLLYLLLNAKRNLKRYSKIIDVEEEAKELKGNVTKLKEAFNRPTIPLNLHH